MSLVRIDKLVSLGDRQLRELGDVLIDCVEGGASVSFVLPMTRDKADAFWREAAAAAREAGKTLLVLGTVTGSDASRLYTRNGWQRAGDIPDYALWPDGRLCPTSYFYGLRRPSLGNGIASARAGRVSSSLETSSRPINGLRRL